MKTTFAVIIALATAASALPGYGQDTCTAEQTTTVIKTQTITLTKPQTVTVTETSSPGSSSWAPQGESQYTTTSTSTAYGHHHHRTPVVHKVKVGGADGKLVYHPEFVSAEVDDIVMFDFLAKNHTVTESTFDSPCVAKYGGFKSGFRPNLNNTEGLSIFNVTVHDKSPHWVYCGQKNTNPPHCQQGMVFAINPPATGNTFSKFKAAAALQPFTPTTNSTSTGPQSAAATHYVVVGGKGADGKPMLRYNPQFVDAAPGDVIAFDFRANVHTVTKSSFQDPCHATGENPFATGPQNNTADIAGKIIKNFVVPDGKPTWFYCGTPTHCPAGMVFAVNPGNKFDEFQMRAMHSGNATASSSGIFSASMATGTGYSHHSHSKTSSSWSSATPKASAYRMV